MRDCISMTGFMWIPFICLSVKILQEEGNLIVHLTTSPLLLLFSLTL